MSKRSNCILKKVTQKGKVGFAKGYATLIGQKVELVEYPEETILQFKGSFDVLSRCAISKKGKEITITTKKTIFELMEV